MDVTSGPAPTGTAAPGTPADQLGLTAPSAPAPALDRFVVVPNGPLSGTVRAGGAKNSVLKLMAACLLAQGRHELTNVPHIVDVEIMSDMLRALGCSVHGPTSGRLVIDTPACSSLRPEAPYELVEKMRASIVVLGPLLSRCGEARVSMPGGDDFGGRPIDIHLDSLDAMGVSFTTSHGYVEGRLRNDRLTGTHLVMHYPSHTATDNLLMAAVLAKGTTVIENAAREPEVVDLAAFLTKMGARIRGAGTSHVEVEGVEELVPASHAVVPDRVVAATYLAATGLAGGEVVIEDARADHMVSLVRKLSTMGVMVEQRPEGLTVSSSGRLTSVDVATLPYPGVATDYKPFLLTLLTVADGVAIVTENLFTGRFRYVDELRRMGADVRTEGHHAVVRGVPRLSGAPVRASDIRAGAALVLAGLVADGETVVSDGWHIDRGYEDLAGGLASLGAQGVAPLSSAGAGPATARPGTPSELLAAASAGDRVALARLVSIVERAGAPSREVARLVYASAPPYTIGLTGAPGAGKSTLTNRLIGAALAGWPAVDGVPAEPVAQLGVVAVDPSSPFSHGAILGDRIRMQDHATDPSVYIRSMATRGHLGGLALAVPEAVRVLGAAGLPLVVVETVGVGQMEVEVASATDTTVVAVTPGWGDSMQANKAGLLEVADLFVVNKADRPGLSEARRDLEQMLDLSAASGWRPPVIATVASTGEGVDELWAAIARHRAHLVATGQLDERRLSRTADELRRVVTARLHAATRQLASDERFAVAVAAITAGTLDPYTAADDLLGPVLGGD